MNRPRHRCLAKPIALLLALVGVLSLATETMAQSYKPDPGPFAVVRIDEMTLVRGEGKAALPLRVRLPRASDGEPVNPRPLVIFSHGAGGDSAAFPDLCDHLASHGYVVINPTHSDSVKLRREAGERIQPGGNLAQQIVGGVRLPERLADVRLILDSLDTIETAARQALAQAGDKQAAPFQIDRQRVAMAGHSAGAMTTQALAGVRFYPRGGMGARAARGIASPEPRIKAFVLISGQGTTTPSLREDSWAQIAAPMLVITGSRDSSQATKETPESRRHPYEFASPGDKYLVYIDGATHSSYSGKQVARLLREDPPDNTDYIEAITTFSTLAFLDRYLRDDPAARAYLESNALTQHPGGKTEYQRK